MKVISKLTIYFPGYVLCSVRRLRAGKDDGGTGLHADGLSAGLSGSFCARQRELRVLRIVPRRPFRCGYLLALRIFPFARHIWGAKRNVRVDKAYDGGTGLARSRHLGCG
ncbi:hypothetical protein StoSoilB19_02100 [Arthrobacter sp. StoSoilB19]|nr:hypothetical protein StoSoilB19_02100 [Arthrobacter sp. StoSoilB19]